MAGDKKKGGGEEEDAAPAAVAANPPADQISEQEVAWVIFGDQVEFHFYVKVRVARLGWVC